MRKGGLHQGKGVIKNSQCPGESMWLLPAPQKCHQINCQWFILQCKSSLSPSAIRVTSPCYFAILFDSASEVCVWGGVIYIHKVLGFGIKQV